ncbi:MAG: 50S ribosomal protein L15 [Candidatus Edwardsbacteria bacterium]|jgi:large subunit ribosomal protein L15|nr:50S ribosomal protein L15 [Candidatus Edwardsbacteria bacterium]
MKLSDVRPARGAVKKHKRLGCGTGSGHGGTSTKGHKGQKARAGSGAKVPRWFEGGQMPLQRRLPKRGFRPLAKTVFQVVNIGALASFSGEVNPQLLHQKRLVDSAAKPVKILGQGELKTALTVKAHAFSQAAKKAIEAAGGTAELLGK